MRVGETTANDDEYLHTPTTREKGITNLSCRTFTLRRYLLSCTTIALQRYSIHCRWRYLNETYDKVHN